MYAANPGMPLYLPPPEPRKNASVRHKSIPTTLVPFRDDTKLVALRYDQTVQAELPIPIPPPRSPLRSTRRPSSLNAAVAPIVIPPPRPAPPTEQHPALRTITSPQTNEALKKRDSGCTPTTCSRSYNSSEDSDTDNEDPFAYERIDAFPDIRPLQLKKRSLSPSLYSEQEERAGRVSESNSSFSIPLSSPTFSSEGNTVSPASPTTPPSNFASKIARTFSLRSNFSKTSLKRLRRKSRSQSRPQSQSQSQSQEQGQGQGQGESMSLRSVATRAVSRVSTTATTTTAPENPGSEPNPNRAAPNHKSPTGRLSPSTDPDASPIISTTIPTDSLLDDDFMTQLSFSKRGSIIFGGKRPRRNKNNPIMADQDGGIGNDVDVERKRAFPLVPKPPIGAPPAQPRQDERGVDAATEETTDRPESRHDATVQAAADAPTTPRRFPPSIRLISSETEKESQKVRSLYEFGEGLKWEHGGRRSSLGERLEPAGDVPSDENEKDAQNDQPGRPTLTSASTSSLPGNGLRRAHELAGGIEDWDGVDIRDVDRYGFILAQGRPESRPATPDESASVRFSPHKHRNVLVRKETASRSLPLRRGPSRKLSARSLNTQASDLSTASRRSTRSAIRQATNLLPHNRDRKLVDEAGDLLALQPGLTHIAEDESAEKIAAELKQKEISRSEKWRKMARVVKPGEEDGQGTLFEFDLKHPKLTTRAWKGIPDCWRAAAWYSFLLSSAKASKEPFITDDQLKADFHRLIEEASPDDAQIDLDVPRTINQHIMFRTRYRGGQRLLFRVLHALSLYFPDTGYVQGMAPLAATFLSYYDEETCFVMLVRLWKYRGLNQIYQSGFAELMGTLKDFERHWLGSKDVGEKLTELCINPTAYATRWYLTLFNLSMPFPVQLRVWDVFLLLGSSPEPIDATVIEGDSNSDEPSSKGLEILHATSLAIIDTLRDTLLDSDFENAMKALTSWVPIKDEQGFMDVVHAEYKQHQSRQRRA
ncbi:rab-GTPase-TBC domain-containing protein [Xylariaceae sp. FL0662B]|nr:rab-GTPase-TBC domain-containing protein [Xylariaceae sp. FL0662B]